MQRGYIIPIGGAEEKEGDPQILSRFVDICGGRNARILILPTASRLENTGHRYERIFRELGVASARALALEERSDGSREDFIAALDEADGFFMTGGNQLRLSTTVGGTPFAKAVRRRNQAGMHVAGTSAGAAYVSAHMIAFGDEGPTPSREKVTLAPGLGLTNSVIVDQHFRQRDRLGRLLTALAFNPFAAGIGLDEDTAAFLGPDNTLTAHGSGALTIVDPSALQFSSMDSISNDEPVCMIGIKIHILVEGATFNIKTRVASPPPH